MADQNTSTNERDPMYWLMTETKQRISKAESVDDFCKLSDVLIRAYDKLMYYN